MISIKNLFYLLLYAWDRFDEGQMASIDAEPDTDLLNLLAKVLERGVDHLLRRGLDRGYLSTVDDIAGVRGKLDISGTVKANLLTRGRTKCFFDEFTHDIRHNQILKASLGQLLCTESLDAKVRECVRVAYMRLPAISEIKLSDRVFAGVQLHRNIRYYGFLMDVCRILFDQLIPKEEEGTYSFRDIARDEVAMRRLFEQFLYNFFRHEQQRFKVRRPRFPWAGAIASRPQLIPQMHTDVTLIRAGNRLVIDAKYTPRVLQRHPRGNHTVRSDHLYQMFAYLRNIPRVAGETCDGMILYPLANDAVDVEMKIPGHRIRIHTVDLNQHWRLLRRELLALALGEEKVA